jgi:predicted permease
MISDMRLAFRQFVKSPGFTFVAVLTLALGIGANTAIFSVINAALLRPLRYPQPQQLVEIWSILPSGFHFATISGPQVKQLREHATKFSDMSLYRAIESNLIDRGSAERVSGLEASVTFLPTLGLNPALGRNFVEGEDELGGGSRVVILTHEWWEARFGGNREIIGQTINLSQTPHTVIGILPPQALVHDQARFIVPLVLDDGAWRMVPDQPWARTLFRLKPNVSFAEAEEEVRALSAELHQRTLSDRPEVRRLQVVSLHDLLTEQSRPTLFMLLGAVTLVLLIASANVANLLLARASDRQKEMAVRSALGASSGRIVRQVLTESLLLALSGATAGVLLAAFGTDLLGHTVGDLLPEMMQPRIDVGVLAFTLLIACGSGILFGIFPALRSRRVDLNCDLKDVGHSATSGGRTRAQSSLIVAEVALTAMLLISAGLLLRSFVRVLHANPGFDPTNVLLCDVALTESDFASPEAVMEYQHTLVRSLEALPGVAAVGTSTTLPLSGESWGGRVSLTKQGHSGSNANGGGMDYVDENYFQVMRIPLLKGRLFAAADNVVDAPRTIILNEAMADSLIPKGEDPIGQQVRLGEQDWEVIGVVGSIRHVDMDEPAKNRVYMPHAFSPWTLRLSIRTHVEPLSLAIAVRETVAAVNADQSVSNFRSLEQAMGRSLRERHVALWLVVVFAGVAVLLACLGIYGVMAYTIGQRQRELSIRMALGAQRRDVIRLVAVDGMRLGLLGIGVGLIGAFAGARLIANHLYEVSASDPLVFFAVVVVITGVAALGILLPARRASNINALDALRAD